MPDPRAFAHEPADRAQRITALRGKEIRFVLPSHAWGGPERQFLQIARELRARFDAKPSFLLMDGTAQPSGPPPLFIRATAEGIAALRVSARDFVGAIRAATAGSDLVCTAGYKADLLLSLAMPVRRLANIRGWTSENRRVRFMEGLDRRSLRMFDAVTAVSREQVRMVLAEGVHPSRVFQVPNAIDLGTLPPPVAPHALRKALGLPEDIALIGSVGRLGPEKGHRYLLEAFSLLRSRFPKAHLVLVGDGPEREALHERAQSLGIHDRCHFLGARPDGAELIGAFSLLVLPSLREGMPNVVLEALAYSTPLVATRVGGVPEMVDHGRTAILADPGDVRGLHDGMHALLSRPACAAEYAEAGLRSVQRTHSVAAQCEAFADAAATALSSGRRLFRL